MMVSNKWKPDRVKELLEALKAAGSVRGAAEKLGVSEASARGAIKQNKIDWKLVVSPHANEEAIEMGRVREQKILELEDKIRELRTSLTSAQSEGLDERKVQERILDLSSATPDVPEWVMRTRGVSRHSAGVPILFGSDWHWAERVDPDQVAGLNEYDMSIAQSRARKFVENTIDLLTNHVPNYDRKGLVLAMGGDMFSGDIHEELLATNEVETGPAFVDLEGVLIWCIEELLKNVGQLFIPWVTGNHGRWTMKIRAKGRAYTSFDWLLGQMLRKHFEKDKRVTFMVGSGSDVRFKVYNHRYMLSHGDQFRGGDGMIGALGPIIRGDHKKRGRASQVGQDYDTLIIGHWHQLIQLRRVIVNGSLKGYDEYAYANNFPFEKPQQALWFTHPQHGITLSMPVLVSASEKREPAPWVSWGAK